MGDLEYVNQWVVSNKAGRVASTWEHHSGTHLVGFVYVDRDAGMSLDFALLCNQGADGKLIRVGGPIDMNTSLKMRYQTWQPLEPTLLPADVRASLGLPETPDWLHFYDDGSMDAMRKLAFLDPFRAPGFPDDIRFPLIRPGMQVEQVWGRLQRAFPQDIYWLVLLNTPNQDFGVKAGDNVLVRIMQLPDDRIGMSFLGKAPFETK